MVCEICQFNCDAGDAFCRKCGKPLSSEGSFKEIDPANQAETAHQILTSSLEILPPSRATPVPEKPGVLNRLSRVIGSENGRKLAKGAALVAVGIGLELAAQAYGKLSRPLISSPTGVKPFIPGPSGNEMSAPIIIESITYQKIYTKKIIRRVQ